MQLLEILQSLFNSVWSFFTGVDVPGLGVSFAWLFLSVFVVKIVISIVRAGLGIGDSSTGYRSGKNTEGKISEERKGDEY